MFYEKVDSLCKKNGTTVTAMVKKLGLSSSSGTNWKNGMEPSTTSVIKIANYFRVSTDYLLLDDIRHHPLTDDETALLKVYQELEHDLQQRLIGRIEMLALADYGDTLNLLRKLRCSGLSDDEIDKILDQHIGNKQGGQGI